jgi:hypothetical protein
VSPGAARGMPNLLQMVMPKLLQIGEDSMGATPYK